MGGFTGLGIFLVVIAVILLMAIIGVIGCVLVPCIKDSKSGGDYNFSGGYAQVIGCILMFLSVIDITLFVAGIWLIVDQ